jgi:hypothetical protein
MNPIVGLALDIFILIALGVTIFYCLRLSKQFNQMRADRRAFEALIQGLNLASARAEASIRAFKEMASGNGDILQDKINKSRALTEELEIMIQAGDSLADRLQDLAEKSRKSAMGEAPAQADEQLRTRAEKELLEAVRANQKS